MLKRVNHEYIIKLEDIFQVGYGYCGTRKNRDRDTFFFQVTESSFHKSHAQFDFFEIVRLPAARVLEDLHAIGGQACLS